MKLGKFLSWPSASERREHKTANELRGATIVAIGSNSVGADELSLTEWIGQVYDFEAAGRYTYALVSVMKHRDRAGDIRDGFCGHERVTVEDGSLQYIAPKLYFWYRP